ncbi:MAG: branched-chain amino acid ABC transporter permease [Candidatus Atribacteria bacterium]|nr:branched-chain amino acid ABC transporter permease [Candidatus Atribacteria bacterium]
MFIEILIVGLSLGAIYALIAIGYSMVYGILKLMNFAHGDTYAFGSFICWMLLTKYDLNPILSIIIAMIVGGVIASIVEILAYRPLRAPEYRNISMISALGVAYIIQNTSENFWSRQVHSFPSIISAPFVSIFGIQIPTTQYLTLGIVIVVVVGLNLFLKHHKVGKAILCASQDIPASSLMGIPINRTISIVYLLGGMIGVIGGVLYASSYNVLSISMGFSGTIVAFEASVFGGIGSINGALVGALILGLLHSLVGFYISTAYRDVITFAVLIIVLLVRPKGILGRYVEEKV